MDLETLYDKTVQLWKIARECQEELSEELYFKSFCHKATGTKCEFFDVYMNSSNSQPVQIICIDEDGGKIRGPLSDFDLL